jgi:GntR family transcriptional repressor for pyruvate dehydrogenase complex
MTNFNASRIELGSRGERVYQSLLKMIASGELQLGQRLPPEKELAEHFNVGRSTVREAIALLRTDGQVTTKPGRGAIVEAASPSTLRLSAAIDTESIHQLFEIRKIIEIEVAGLAAERRTEKDLKKIEMAYAEMERAATESRNAPSVDLSFHMAIAQAAKNPQLMTLVQFISLQLGGLIRQSWKNSAIHAGGPGKAQAEHFKILEAIRTGDARGAKSAARSHLIRSEKRLSLVEKA